MMRRRIARAAADRARRRRRIARVDVARERARHRHGRRALPLDLAAARGDRELGLEEHGDLRARRFGEAVDKQPRERAERDRSALVAVGVECGRRSRARDRRLGVGRRRRARAGGEREALGGCGLAGEAHGAYCSSQTYCPIDVRVSIRVTWARTLWGLQVKPLTARGGGQKKISSASRPRI